MQCVVCFRVWALEAHVGFVLSSSWGAAEAPQHSINVIYDHTIYIERDRHIYIYDLIFM